MLAAGLQAGEGINMPRPKNPTSRVLLTFSSRPGRLRSLLLHPLGGGLGPFTGLVPPLARQGPVHGLRAAGLTDREEPDHTIEAMLRRYSTALRQLSVAPNLLVGYSLGGLLAWELAVVLAREGPPPRVVLIDSSPDPWQLSEAAEADLRSAVLGQAVEDRDDLTALRRTVDAHIAARRGYRVTNRYLGPTLLIPCTAIDGTAQSESWSALADNLTVQPIRCGHFDVFNRENLPIVLQLVRTFLKSDHAMSPTYNP
ncbi:alpha/beta fold hydrolase [Salinispora arenicola]|uniref:thioesterase domain-containing protein n=1 Tax=Salinispora arenicola TaxID=168697 RepID=UPI001E2F56F7|nr:alpha/beta fold hydrolase [Salinispora arenicola]